MRSCDVIGYVVGECTIICADCLEEGEDDSCAIFPYSETDCPSHCERCGELIPESLTSDGQEYVREEVWNGTGVREVLEVWAAEYDWAFPQCCECGKRFNRVGDPPADLDGKPCCAECAAEAIAKG